MSADLFSSVGRSSASEPMTSSSASPVGAQMEWRRVVKDDFVTIATGAVLFTLLVQGMTVERLVRRLELDR